MEFNVNFNTIIKSSNYKFFFSEKYFLVKYVSPKFDKKKKGLEINLTNEIYF